MLKVWKKSWEPFGSCLLNSTANPAHFHPSLAGLAVLFSRQLPNGSHDFFQTFSICFLIISLRTHKPKSPSHFWHIISQLQVVCSLSNIENSPQDLGCIYNDFCRSETSLTQKIAWSIIALHVNIGISDGCHQNNYSLLTSQPRVNIISKFWVPYFLERYTL